MRHPARPPLLPIPSSLDEWNDLWGSNRLAEYFTPDASAAGTTARFLTAYAALVACSHRNAVPVEDLFGERVATLCPDCDRQLPADWGTARKEGT